MQKRNKFLIPIITGILAVVTVLGAFTFRSVYAQSPTPTPGASDGQAAPETIAPGQERRGGPGVGTSDTQLAGALGITTAQLQTAYDTANAEAIKEAVAKGLISQEQADQMSSGGKHGFGRFGKPGSASGIDYDALLARALDITTEQLQAARQTAYNTGLDAALKDGALTQEQVDLMKGRQALANDSTFQSTIQAAYKSGVKQAVIDGVITQAQADAILAGQSPTDGFFGRGVGGPGGRGGRGGPGFNGNPPATPETQNN